MDSANRSTARYSVKPNRIWCKTYNTETKSDFGAKHMTDLAQNVYKTQNVFGTQRFWALPRRTTEVVIRAIYTADRQTNLNGGEVCVGMVEVCAGDGGVCMGWWKCV